MSRKTTKKKQHRVESTEERVIRILSKSLNQHSDDERGFLLKHFGMAFVRGERVFVDRICRAIYAAGVTDTIDHLEAFGDLFFGLSLPAIKQKSRVYSFALLGVLEHEADYHVGRPDDLSEIERNVAQALGVHESHVHASPVLAHSYNEYEQGMCYERFALIHDAHLLANRASEMVDLNLPEHNFKVGAASNEYATGASATTPVAIYITLCFDHRDGLDAQAFFDKQEAMSDQVKSFDTFNLTYEADGQRRNAKLSVIDAGLPGSVYARGGYYLEILEAIEAMEIAEQKVGGLSNLSFNMEPIEVDLLSSYCHVSIHSANGRMIEKYNTRPVRKISALLQNLDMVQRYKLQGRSILFPEMASTSVH